jgi:hypothetical protein
VVCNEALKVNLHIVHMRKGSDWCDASAEWLCLEGFEQMDRQNDDSTINASLMEIVP